jgi:hypothetical protein
VRFCKKTDILSFTTFVIFLGMLLTLTSCGVKMAPLPPLAVIPQQTEIVRPSPVPSPSASPTPTPESPYVPFTPGIPRQQTPE